MSLGPDWNLSASCPEQDIASSLRADDIARRREYCGLDAAADGPLQAAAATIQSDSCLLRLFRHLYWRLYVCPEKPPGGDWPLLAGAMSSRAGCFHLLLALGLAPHLQRHHAVLGFPSQVTRDTAAQVACFADRYARGHDSLWGVDLGPLRWLRNYLHGNVYVRLGRLEYWPKPFAGETTACRHRATGEWIVLAAGGIPFGPDGLAVYSETPADHVAWTSTLSTDDRSVTGHPVSPDGRAGCDPIRLSRTEWDVVLQKGTDVLELHIPSGGGLTLEACADSMRRAREFFARYVPWQRYAGVVCASWVFNPNLGDFLPPEANLVRLLGAVRLFPIRITPNQGMHFIFFRETPFDPATTQRNTSLQRAVLDYLAAGNTWRCGGMFVPAQEMVPFGRPA